MYVEINFPGARRAAASVSKDGGWVWVTGVKSNQDRGWKAQFVPKRVGKARVGWPYHSLPAWFEGADLPQASIQKERIDRGLGEKRDTADELWLRPAPGMQENPRRPALQLRGGVMEENVPLARRQNFCVCDRCIECKAC